MQSSMHQRRPRNRRTAQAVSLALAAGPLWSKADLARVFQKHEGEVKVKTEGLTPKIQMGLPR